MARIIDAFTQFFDDNGDPLVDGWLRFTESGTNNTDKDTFKDSGETIANTNPVQLDGAGRCPSVFGTGSYNVRSFTDDSGSPGVQMQQFDPVGGDVTDGAFSDWVASTAYSDGAIVTGPDGKYYRSLISGNENNDPTISPTQWEEVQFTGVYNSSIEYAIGELVIDDDGYLYRSLVASNLNNTPADNPSDWGVAILQTDLSAVTFTHDMTSDADYTLSFAENRYGRVVVTDTGVLLTASRNIIVSGAEREFITQNDTLQTLTFKTAAGSGIAVLAGEAALLVSDGVDVVDILGNYYTKAEVDEKHAILHVQDQKTTGTSGGSSIAGVNTRDLNTEITNEITGASLGSNQITLLAGTYWIEASAPAIEANEHRAYLYNVTDAATEVLGTSAYNTGANKNSTTSIIKGRFTIGITKVFELRHYIALNQITYGLGEAVSDGQTEIYSDVLITKVP